MCSLIWSVCVTVDEIGRKKLDVFIREKDGIFPLKDTIYEYFIDVRNRAFISWEEKLPKMWKYNERLDGREYVTLSACTN